MVARTGALLEDIQQSNAASNPNATVIGGVQQSNAFTNPDATVLDNRIQRSEQYETATAPVEWTGVLPIGDIVRSEQYETPTAPVEWTGGGVIGAIVQGRFIPQSDLVLDGILYDIDTDEPVPSHHVVFANQLDTVFDWGASAGGPNGGYLVVIANVRTSFDINNYRQWFFKPVQCAVGASCSGAQYFYVQEVVQRGPTTFDLYGKRICPAGLVSGGGGTDPGNPIGSVRVNGVEVGQDCDSFHFTRGVNEIATGDLVLWNLSPLTPPAARHNDIAYLDDIRIRMGKAEDGLLFDRFNGLVENTQPASAGYKSQLALQLSGYERFLAKGYVKCWNQRFRSKTIIQILQGTTPTSGPFGDEPGIDSLLFGVKVQVRYGGTLLDLPVTVVVDPTPTNPPQTIHDADVTRAILPFFSVSDGLSYHQAVALLADLVGYRFGLTVGRDGTGKPEVVRFFLLPREGSASVPTAANTFTDATIQQDRVRRDSTQVVDMVQVIGNRDGGILGQFPLVPGDTSPAFDPLLVKKVHVVELENLLDQSLADRLAKQEYLRRTRIQLEGAFSFDGTDAPSTGTGEPIKFSDTVNAFTNEVAEAKRITDQFTHDLLGAPKWMVDIEPDKGIYLQQRSIAELALAIRVAQAFSAFVKPVTEEPAGTKDGLNQQFLLSSEAAVDSPVRVELNGIPLDKSRWTLRGKLLTVNTAVPDDPSTPLNEEHGPGPNDDDLLTVTYLAVDPPFTCVIRVAECVKVCETVTSTLETPGTNPLCTSVTGGTTGCAGNPT